MWGWLGSAVRSGPMGQGVSFKSEGRISRSGTIFMMRGSGLGVRAKTGVMCREL